VIRKSATAAPVTLEASAGSPGIQDYQPSLQTRI